MNSPEPARRNSQARTLFHLDVLQQAAKRAWKLMLPWRQLGNPVMFLTHVAAVLAAIGALQILLFSPSRAGYAIAVTFILILTLFLAHFAEALCEARGKIQADSLRQARQELKARVISRGEERLVMAFELRVGDLFLVHAGETIAADGNVEWGVATVDESAITGESAPVVRAAGSERASVTGGTRVISDSLKVRVTQAQEESFLDHMIAMVEGARRQKTPQELALVVFFAGLTLAFLLLVASLWPVAQFFRLNLDLHSMLALFVCLVPTSAGALVSAVGVAGLDRILRANVIAKSARVVELAGDIDTVLLDKTGTITQGHRVPLEIFSCNARTLTEAAHVLFLTCVGDTSTEGLLLREFAPRGVERWFPPQHVGSQFVPFSAQTRLSGIDLPNGFIFRKGSPEFIRKHVLSLGGSWSAHCDELVKALEERGHMPLALSEGAEVVGVVALEDVLMPGIGDRIARLNALGLRVVMVTGDSPAVAAATAAQVGIASWVAGVNAEGKLGLIRAEQAQGRLVAMMGDGTSDAPSLAQANLGMAMNTGTQAAKEAGNMVDLDSDPTKLIEIIEIGHQLQLTRGALTTFSIANDVAKLVALLPALFFSALPHLASLNIMGLTSPRSAVLSTLIYNALVVVGLVPVSIYGVRFRPASADKMLVRHLFTYGTLGLFVPFACIKVLDVFLSQLGLV